MRKSIHMDHDRINQVVLLIILALSYLYFLPRWADQNTNSRMDMIIAVVNDGTFQIDRYVQNTVDFARVGDHFYSDKPPGVALIGIPLYAGLKVFLQSPLIDPLVTRLSNNPAFQDTLNAAGSGISADKVRNAISQVILTYLIITLPSLLLAWLLYRMLRKMQVWPSASLMTVLVFGLLTPAFAYSNEFYSHQFSAALLFAAFYLAYDRQKITQVGRLLAIGLLIGYAVISEYQVVLIGGILFLYTAFQLFRQKSLPKVLWVTASGLLVAAGWMFYNNAIFGGPFHISYSYSADWTVQHGTGFMSLTFPHLDALWGMTFSLFRGLFLLSPILLLALPGFVIWWRGRANRPEWVVVLTTTLAMCLFNSSSVMWWGGFAIGPRYFLPALPFMVLPLGIFLGRYLQKPWGAALAWILAAFSWISTWGMTLAGQSFPSDTIFNPYQDFMLPNWQAGNIARNLGTLMGFRGLSSLAPLVFGLLLIALAWFLLGHTVIAKQKLDSWKIENSSLS